METESKESLELQKLKAELKKLELDWWKQPEYISAIATMIVGLLAAVATIGAAYIGGLFATERNLSSTIEKQQGQIKILKSDTENLRSNVEVARNNVLTLQAEQARANKGSQGDRSLVIFSTDPSLSIQEPFSAEFEVQIAKDKLEKSAVVFQRGSLYSTGLLFETEQDAQKRLKEIQKILDRPSAFITSLEAFCSNPITQEQKSIGGGSKYPYTLFKCK